MNELVPLAIGARIRAVDPLPPRDLLLVLEPGALPLRRLRLSADPQAARIHLQIAPVKRHEGPSDPFFARVRAALEGAELHGLEQLREDRVVRFSTRRAGRPGATLIAELTGRHANLVLLDEHDRIAQALVRPASGSAAGRRLAPGTTYELPPGKKPDADPGPSLADCLAAPAEPPPLAQLVPLSARVEAALGQVARTRYDAEARRELVRRLERRLQGARALVAGLRERERACGEAERVLHDGELLLAHLARLSRGMSEAVLPDDFQPGSPPRTIPLDPGLTPRRNAEKLFARHRKLRRTLEHLPEELALAGALEARLAELLERAASSDSDPAALEGQAIEAGVLAPKRERPGRAPAKPRLPYLRFRGAGGSEIRVGRTAPDNDRLTFRESRGNDLWLHTADAPGSHVVLRLEPGAEPAGEEVLDAAHLAVHFSPLRGAARADVHVARCKEVHKPRKVPPGLVTLSGGKVLRVRLEPARLERLLASRARPTRGTPEGSGEDDP